MTSCWLCRHSVCLQLHLFTCELNLSSVTSSNEQFFSLLFVVNDTHSSTSSEVFKRCLWPTSITVHKYKSSAQCISNNITSYDLTTRSRLWYQLMKTYPTLVVAHPFLPAQSPAKTITTPIVNKSSLYLSFVHIMQCVVGRIKLLSQR